jgi:hypothetical protein
MTQTLNLAVMRWNSWSDKEQKARAKWMQRQAAERRFARYRLAAAIKAEMPSLEDTPIGTQVAVVSSPCTKKVV